MIRLLIFLLAAGFGDARNPSKASLPIWLHHRFSKFTRISHDVLKVWTEMSLLSGGGDKKRRGTDLECAQSFTVAWKRRECRIQQHPTFQMKKKT